MGFDEWVQELVESILLSVSTFIFQMEIHIFLFKEVQNDSRYQFSVYLKNLAKNKRKSEMIARQ